MRTVSLWALVLALLWPSTSWGDPPRVGAPVSMEESPIFKEPIVCDTKEQIEEIAHSEDPLKTAEKYFEMVNKRFNKVCAPSIVRSIIQNVVPLGLTVYIYNAHKYKAWAVDVGWNHIPLWVLWLEVYPVTYL
jgi:hypothetical protein